MTAATDVQVQNFVSERIRPRVEQIRSTFASIDGDLAAIDDIYEALNVPTPTWKDTRNDGPPHLLTPNDVLAINAFLHDIRDAIKNHAQYPVVLKACVHSVG